MPNRRSAWPSKGAPSHKNDKVEALPRRDRASTISVPRQVASCEIPVVKRNHDHRKRPEGKRSPLQKA